jgi:hypothetical protein
LVLVFFVCAVIIGLGTMFPNGELMAGAGELWEGLVQLLSTAGDAISGAV